MRQGEDGLGRENYLNGDLETKRSTGFLGTGIYRPRTKAVGLTSGDPIIQGYASYLRGLESSSEQTKTRKHLKEFK